LSPLSKASTCRCPQKSSTSRAILKRRQVAALQKQAQAHFFNKVTFFVRMPLINLIPLFISDHYFVLPGNMPSSNIFQKMLKSSSRRSLLQLFHFVHIKKRKRRLIGDLFITGKLDWSWGAIMVFKPPLFSFLIER